MGSIRRYLFFISFIPITFFMLSCNFITEPERYYNDKAYPPETRTFNFNDIENGQHVDGTILFEIEPSDFEFTISRVDLLVDSSGGKRRDNEPWIVSLDTRATHYSEGLHNIVIGIYDQDRNHGVLNLLDPATIYFEKQLYFDRTPPKPVTVTALQSQTVIPTITWTKSLNENYYAYKVLRSYDTISWETLRTVYNRNDTTMVDSTVQTITGLEVHYKVIVATDRNFHYTSESNICSHYLGIALYYSENLFGSSIYWQQANPVKPEIYFVIAKKIIAYSSVDNTYLRELFIPDLPDNSLGAQCAISRDGQFIFIHLYYTNKFWIVNTDNLVIEKAIILNYPIEILGMTNPIYFVDNNTLLFQSGNKKLRFVDIEQNTVIDSTIAPLNTEYTAAEVADEGNKLILANYYNDGMVEANYYKILDLTTPGFPIILQRDVDEVAHVICFVKDHNSIIIDSYSEGDNQIYIRDLATLDLRGTISGNNSGRIRFGAYGDHKIFIKADDELLSYEITSLSLENNWTVSNYFAFLDYSNNYLYYHSTTPYIIGFAIEL